MVRRTHWNGLATRSTGGAEIAFDSDAIVPSLKGSASLRPSLERVPSIDLP